MDRTLDASAPDRASILVRQTCDAVGSFIEYWGFKSILGRVWTLLALRVEPMSQVEIAEFLGVSRSLVSGAMADLTARGLVRATSDHRNAPFEAVVDIWPTISDVLRDREWMLIESARMSFEALVDELDVDEGGRWHADRARFLLRMTELAQGFLRLLIGLRVPRKLEGMGDWLRSSSRFFQGLRELRS